MAKKGIHPEKNKVKIVFLSKDKSNNSSEIEVFSATNQDMIAEIRIEDHPAWQQDRTQTIIVNKAAQKFSDKSKMFFDEE